MFSNRSFAHACDEVWEACDFYKLLSFFKNAVTRRPYEIILSVLLYLFEACRVLSKSSEPAHLLHLPPSTMMTELLLFSICFLISATKVVSAFGLLGGSEVCRGVLRPAPEIVAVAISVGIPMYLNKYSLVLTAACAR
jgi:hypothetical protein